MDGRTRCDARGLFLVPPVTLARSRQFMKSVMRDKVVSLPSPNGAVATHLLSNQRQFIVRQPVRSSLLDRILRTEGGGVDSNGRNADGLPNNATQSGPSHRTGVGMARASLLTVAALFGSLNVCLRLVYALPDPPAPSVVGLVRGVFTALCFAPSLLRLIFHTASRRSGSHDSSHGSKGDADGLWSAAFWLGLWNVASQGLLTVGLTMTSSSVRASFLAQSSVVITPLISVLGGQAVKPSVWGGAVVAIVGLLILSSTDGDVGNVDTGYGLSGSNTGDLLVLGCAVCWSMYLFQFGQIAHRFDKLSLQSATCAIRCGMYIAWFLIAAIILRSKEGNHGLLKTMQSMWLGWQDLRAWGLLLFSAVGSGALAGLLQQKGQATLSASEANIILSSEPIWAGMLAWLFLGELLSPKENLGGLIIFFAAVVATGPFDGLLSRAKIKRKATDSKRKAKDSSHPRGGEL